MTPLSIPSPPEEWRTLEFTIDFRGWLHDWFSWWPEEWTIGVNLYALAIMLGVVIAVVVSNVRLTARGAERWVVIDLAFWGVLFGIVGARAWHVVTHPDDYFGPGKDLWRTLYIWEGGLAIFGAILFGALGVYIGSRIVGLRFGVVADAIAPTLLLAQAVGRLGNYFNQELFGIPTDLPWGLEIDRPNPAIPAGIPADAVFHPVFLYEMIWNLAGFAILLLIENRVWVRRADGRIRIESRRRDFWHWGKMMGLWAIWYGAGRVWFESIRLDPLETFLGIRYNVWGALAAIVAGLLIIIVQTRLHTGIEPGAYLPGRSGAAALDSNDVYPDTEPDDQEAGPQHETASATSGAARN